MKIYLLSILFLLSAVVFGQEEMGTDFEEAMKQAKLNSSAVVLVFTGSDWCVPCIKLKKEILSTDEFKNTIDKNLVFINADFPQKKKNKELQPENLQMQNKTLAERYNPKGYFPLLVMIDTDRNVLQAFTYEDVGPADFAKQLNKVVEN